MSAFDIVTNEIRSELAYHQAKLSEYTVAGMTDNVLRTEGAIRALEQSLKYIQWKLIELDQKETA